MTDHDLLLQIVHKLDHMATKEDIVNFATKDDLRASIDEVKAEFNDKLSNFATKDDLRASIDEVKAEFNDKLSNFATKDDLANFATKDDLAIFATKDDLANFATKDDLKEAIEDAKSELYDEIVLCEKDIDEIKEQMSFFKAAKLEYDNQILFIKKLSNLETRVEKLEAQTG